MIWLRNRLRSRRALRSGLVTIMTIVLGGCVTSSTFIDATVKGLPGPCASAGAATPAAPLPLAGAAVSMLCPQVIKADGPSLFASTDEEGELHFEEPVFGRWIHDGCDLLVEKPGFQAKRLHVADVCVEYSSNHCIRAVVNTELAPLEGSCSPP